MNSFDFPQTCTKCQGYKTIPYSWNSTEAPRMCSCPKVSLSWECTRCGKINAPWKGSCDCTSSTLINVPISDTQTYDSGNITFPHYYQDLNSDYK